MSGLTPVIQNLPANSDPEIFNITSFGGINIAENPFAVSSSTASDMKNLYINDEGTLATRPRLQYEDAVGVEVVQVLDLKNSKYDDIGDKLLIYKTDSGYKAKIEDVILEPELPKGQAYLGLDDNNKSDIYYTSVEGLYKLDYDSTWREVISEPQVRRIYKSTDSVLEFSEVNDENLLSQGYIDQAYFDPYVNYISPEFKTKNGINWNISNSFNISNAQSFPGVMNDWYYLSKKNKDIIFYNLEGGLAIERGWRILNNLGKNELIYKPYTEKLISFFGDYKKGYVKVINQPARFQLYTDEQVDPVTTTYLSSENASYIIGYDFLDNDLDTTYISILYQEYEKYYYKIYAIQYKINDDENSNDYNELTVNFIEVSTIPIVKYDKLNLDLLSKHEALNTLLVDERSNIYFYNTYDSDLYLINEISKITKILSFNQSYTSSEKVIITDTDSVYQDYHILTQQMDIKNGYVYITIPKYRYDEYPGYYSVIDRLDVYNLSNGTKVEHTFPFFTEALATAGYSNNSIVSYGINSYFIGNTNLNKNQTTPVSITEAASSHKIVAGLSTEQGIANFYVYDGADIDLITITYNSQNSVEPNLSTTVLYSDDEKYDHTHPYVTTFDDKLWFFGGEGNIVRFTSDLTSSFLPKKNYDDIGDGSPITGMLQVSDNYLAIFKADTAYMITEDSETEDLYYVTNLKTKLGNVPQNQAIVTGLSNQSVVINDYGIYALGQSKNSVDTDTIFTSISEAINPKLVLLKDKDKIKTHNHRFLTYFYKSNDNSTHIWVYDNRSSQWYFWELPIAISCMAESNESTDSVDERVTTIYTIDGKCYTLTTSEFYRGDTDKSSGESHILTYQDYIGPNNVGEPLFKRIDWYWKSQPLTLKAINYLKKLNEVGLIFADNDRVPRTDTTTQEIIDGAFDSSDNLQLFYKFKTYRKKSRLLNSSYVNNIDYLVNARIKPRVQKFDFVEMELSNKISDDNGNITYTYTGDEDEYNKGLDILDKLNLIGITFKYTLSSGA